MLFQCSDHEKIYFEELLKVSAWIKIKNLDKRVALKIIETSFFEFIVEIGVHQCKGHDTSCRLSKLLPEIIDIYGLLQALTPLIAFTLCSSILLRVCVMVESAAHQPLNYVISASVGCYHFDFVMKFQPQLSDGYIFAAAARFSGSKLKRHPKTTNSWWLLVSSCHVQKEGKFICLCMPFSQDFSWG